MRNDEGLSKVVGWRWGRRARVQRYQGRENLWDVGDEEWEVSGRD